MKTRIITAAIALAVFAGVLAAPPVVFTISLASVILFMLYECYTATKADVFMKTAGFISAALIMIVISGYTHLGDRYALLSAAVVIVIMLHMVLIVAEHGRKDYKAVLANGFLTMYIVLSASCIWLAKEWFGISMMLLIFICAWSADTFAYFSGKLFGKYKLIPHVSPNKTIEGSIGGVIGAMICCILYLLILNTHITLPVLLGAVLGGIGGVCSQFGDLAASAIKRDTGIKDFGWIFPGHGGFMDRFDSVIFIAPIIMGMLMIWQVI